ncbi:glucokinase [Halospina denitrificans]|uniref:Glucokinase n=1 Tax=Halospina denitrificans TaxID=332522 RepID=A0A4R7JU42_9GAMM|nr:glucokinase [Halospina denitrificans]TDT41424.1 glucokinase [Halospina denitrificans]
MKVLVGDIGGTNARFRLLEGEGHQWCLRHQSTWSSPRFDSLEALLEALMSNFSRLEKATIDEAWLAVAGPVRAGRVTFTNLPWQADSQALAARFGWNRVSLINDLEALAHAVPSLGAKELMPLQHGSPGNANCLVVAVGTGLGVATFKTQDHGVDVFASEGGHIDFAPADPDDFRLLEYLRTRYGHISQERVLSGRGLADLYRFVCDEQGAPPESALLEADDPAAAINQRAESAQAPMAVAAIERFSGLLGRFLGNAALFSAALGGVYLCGGVATRLYPYLTNAAFLDAFLDRGRMKPMMERIPVWTIASTEVGLNGVTALATRYAVTGMPIDACAVDHLSQAQS